MFSWQLLFELLKQCFIHMLIPTVQLILAAFKWFSCALQPCTVVTSQFEIPAKPLLSDKLCSSWVVPYFEMAKSSHCLLISQYIPAWEFVIGTSLAHFRIGLFKNFHLSSKRFGDTLQWFGCCIFSDYLLSVKDAYCVISQVSSIAGFWFYERKKQNQGGKNKTESIHKWTLEVVLHRNRWAAGVEVATGSHLS